MEKIILETKSGYTQICTIDAVKYAANDALCLIAVEVGRDEIFATLTTNVEDHWNEVWAGTPSENNYPKFPELILKDYSENEGFVEQLKVQGVISGYAALADCNQMFKYARLTPKWEEIIKKQLDQ